MDNIVVFNVSLLEPRKFRSRIRNIDFLLFVLKHFFLSEISIDYKELNNRGYRVKERTNSNFYSKGGKNETMIKYKSLHILLFDDILSLPILNF